MKKTLSALALAGILTFSLGTAAAQAAPDYPAPAPPVVSGGTVAPGQPFTFAAAGFTPGEIVDVTVTQTSPVAGGALGSLGGGVSMAVPMIVRPAAPQQFTTTAAADGSFAVPITLNEGGTHTLTATGRTSGKSVSQVVKVVDPAAGGGTGNGGSGTGKNVADGEKGGLANTGIDTGVLVWSIVGAGALAAGVGTVVVSRRRSRSTIDA
ncbi:LPXTG cell wall anchor domain-containing protein [Arthrobacter sp. HLT1-20]